MTTPLKPMDRLGEAKECWVLVNEYGAITNVRLTPPDDTKYPEQWRWQRFVAQDFAPNVNPLDREAWEKRLRDFEQFIRVDAADEASNSKGIEPNYGTYADELKTVIVTDILALQSQRDAAIADVCTMHNRIEDIDRQHDADLKEVQSQLTEARAEVERLGNENRIAIDALEALQQPGNIVTNALAMIEKARQPK